MTEGSSKTQEILPGSDFDAVVRYGGTTVELSPGGHVVVRPKGNAIVYTNGDVRVRPAAHDDTLVPPIAPEDVPAGRSSRMEDGTVLAGYYEGKPLYTAPADAPLTYTFTEAAKYAEQINAQKHLGHDDWRVPNRGELNVLFTNRALIGGFREDGSYPAGWYLSALRDNSLNVWCQRFDGYYAGFADDGIAASLRCVRG